VCPYAAAAIAHAAAKAEKMGVALSLETYAKRAALQVIEDRPGLWGDGASLEVGLHSLPGVRLVLHGAVNKLDVF
jgi:hypothetical protein